MNKVNELLLLSGNDIPWKSAQLSVHQPTLKEIALIGEEQFFIGCELLNLRKESLSDQDKVNLANQTDFDIIMSIMANRTNPSLLQGTIAAISILTLLFPAHEVRVHSTEISLVSYENNEDIHFLNNQTFEEFRDIISSMFSLTQMQHVTYNPKGDMATKIAEKLKKGAEKRAKQKGSAPNKITIFSRYISILSIGLHQSLNTLINHTPFQIYDMFKRFELKEAYDLRIKVMLAGAKDTKEAEPWMKDLYE